MFISYAPTGSIALKRDRNVGFRSENGGGVKKIAILARCEEKGVGGPGFAGSFI